ncbi:tRNA sulfurtransferase [Serratia symbiotica]|nr:tRNA sulfurtransferase [Serratia symbiotica]
MKLIIKLFPEITIKSKSVRIRFIKILSNNIRNVLKKYINILTIIYYWDYIEIYTKNKENYEIIIKLLIYIPGIHHILLIKDFIFTDMNSIFQKTLIFYHKKLLEKKFCVRVKRQGKQNFTSQDLECYLGKKLIQNVKNSNVNLTNPDIIINLEIKDKKLILIKKRFEGICGYPIGTQEDVLSLISGGFDSGVSSYMMMRRGCRVHFCFFNLGGTEHEIGVKNIAYYLWNRFSSSHKLNFFNINFIPILNEILEKTDKSYMGVILKRMMIKAASKIAKLYKINALITGESLGQVSSQTLSNLNSINNISNILILRPLISYDKEQIIKISRIIGTENLTKNIPEYCQIISKKPTVKAIKSKIEYEEKKINFITFNKVINETKKSFIHNHKKTKIINIETVKKINKNDIILDLRLNEDSLKKPLKLKNVEIKSLPFYKLQNQFKNLDQNKTYLLYCEKGFMSRIQALYLIEHGYNNIKIYNP